MIVTILRWVICVAYGGLTLLASVSSVMNGKKPLWALAVMALGAIMLIIVCWKAPTIKSKLWIVVMPLLLVHIGALGNGLYAGNINVLHHIIRLGVSIIVFLLFCLHL